ALLDLPAPHEAQWRQAITLAAASLPVDRQGGIKVVLTRGVEGSGTPTGWIVASPADGDFAQRETGIRVVTLDRGYSSDVAQRAPWLLPGAKTLSYAVNMAALREAGRRGADDVIFVTSDGFVMEAPTSTVILPASEIARADASWLVSSVRLAAPITHLDGAEVSVDREFTRAMNAALLA